MKSKEHIIQVLLKKNSKNIPCSSIAHKKLPDVYAPTIHGMVQKAAKKFGVKEKDITIAIKYKTLKILEAQKAL